MQNKENSPWVEKYFSDPQFVKCYAVETFVEDFLMEIEKEMKRQGISRAELANKMGCKLSDLTGVIQRTKDLSAPMMVEMAFHLGLALSLKPKRLRKV